MPTEENMFVRSGRDPRGPSSGVFDPRYVTKDDREEQRVREMEKATSPPETRIASPEEVEERAKAAARWRDNLQFDDRT
jgi:hypothetical protein